MIRGKMPIERCTVSPHFLHVDEAGIKNIFGI
jgi:hypothetical protein